MDNEKIFIGLALLALVAILIFHKRGGPAIGPLQTELPATDIVGLSQTPENSSMTRGPSYMMANRPYFFGPPLDNFLPTVAANSNSLLPQFVRRFVGGKEP